MYWVIAYTAEPGSRWDFLPASFLSHHAALEYACDLAEDFIAASDAPKSVTVLIPDEGTREWPVEALKFTRSWGLA